MNTDNTQGGSGDGSGMTQSQNKETQEVSQNSGSEKSSEAEQAAKELVAEDKQWEAELKAAVAKDSVGPSLPDMVREVRLKVDKFINSVHKHMLPSREVSLVFTNLQLGKMWLGKLQGELGSPTPYPQSDNPGSAVIEKQAEHTDETLFGEWADIEQTQVARVKSLRAHIDKQVAELEPIMYGSGKANIYNMTAILALEEAKMWLGQELNRIKTIQDNGGIEPSRPLISIALY